MRFNDSGEPSDHATIRLRNRIAGEQRIAERADRVIFATGWELQRDAMIQTAVIFE